MNADVDIINYGIGNIRSVENAILKLNFKSKVILNPAELKNSKKIILPGIGSFSAAVKLLNEGGWIEAIKEQVLEKNKLLFGICLGMQLLGTNSEEHGLSNGLNLIPGQIKDLKNLIWKGKISILGKFLIARMLYADGLNAIIVMGGIFAVGVFNLEIKEKVYRISIYFCLHQPITQDK